MRTVNIHAAKTHLSRLVEEAAQGEGFIIAKAGKPMVKVVALDAPPARKIKRLGFMKGEFEVPDDFDTMGQKEIEAMFGLGDPDPEPAPASKPRNGGGRKRAARP